MTCIRRLASMPNQVSSLYNMYARVCPHVYMYVHLCSYVDYVYMCMYMCMCICGHTMFVYFLFCHWNVLVSSMNMCVCMSVWGGGQPWSKVSTEMFWPPPFHYYIPVKINIWIYVYTRVYIPKYMYTLLMENK